MPSRLSCGSKPNFGRLHPHSASLFWRDWIFECLIFSHWTWTVSNSSTVRIFPGSREWGKEGRGEGGGRRGESSGVILYKKCHGSAKILFSVKMAILLFWILNLFANIKVTFVRQILWMYIKGKTLFRIPVKGYSNLQPTPGSRDTFCVPHSC